VHEKIVEEAVKDSEITSLEIQEVNSDLESMPDDEILSMSGFEEADDNDSENVEELSLADKHTADNVIDELVDMANTQDANLNVECKAADAVDPILKKMIRSIVKIPRDILFINAKQLQTNVEKNAADIHELLELVRELRFQYLLRGSNNPMTLQLSTNARGEKMSSTLFIHSSDEEPPTKKFKVVLEDYPIPSPTHLNSVPDKGKGIAQISGDDKLKQLIPLIEKGGSTPNLSNLNQSKLMRKWVATQAEKLGIPSPPELTAFELSLVSKKRNRTAEIIKVVFVKDDIVVDEMHTKLFPHAGVIGSPGLVIDEPKARIFVYD
nr:hypothetical protein [Tanacetum cinerariifolium]GEZ83929.1 hypothetical protein [Tanacetum cinerariifolium]